MSTYSILEKPYPSFKERYQLAARKVASDLVRKVHHGIPVVLENPEKSVLLRPTNVSDDDTVKHLLNYIRNELELGPDQRLYMFAKMSAYTENVPIATIYERHVDEDGYLYLTFNSQLRRVNRTPLESFLERHSLEERCKLVASCKPLKGRRIPVILENAVRDALPNNQSEMHCVPERYSVQRFIDVYPRTNLRLNYRDHVSIFLNGIELPAESLLLPVYEQHKNEEDRLLYLTYEIKYYHGGLM